MQHRYNVFTDQYIGDAYGKAYRKAAAFFFYCCCELCFSELDLSVCDLDMEKEFLTICGQPDPLF